MDAIGEVVIHGLWEIKTDIINDVIFEDVDADTYKHKPMDKLVASW